MRSLLCLTVVSFATFLLSAQNAGRGGSPAGGAPPRPMTLAIPGFPDGGNIPVKFSQAAPGVAAGEGTSPTMSWANAPAGTQSFFLHMHDMDLAATRLLTIRRTGFFGTFRRPRLACPKAYPRDRNCPTGAIRSAPQDPCTAVREPPRTARFTTTCLSFTPWIPNWT